MVNRFLSVICFLAPVALVAQQSQTPAAQPSQTTVAAASPSAQAIPEGGMPEYVRPETAEQRQARVGTQEDPGLDPDPKKVFWRYGKEYYIHKYELRTASRDQAIEGWIRPYGPANIHAEIYQQNEKYVWVWWPVKPPEPEDVLVDPVEPPPLTKEGVDYLVGLQPEYSELKPLDSGITVRFAESSEGLPNTGSWRNALDVADMNGDGFLDIVAPPQRKGNGLPEIFLGDGKGNWTVWRTHWPYTIDYGAVAAGDFNKDGHMDLVSAIHLVGLRAFLGDGKGNFTDASEGLPSDYPTRDVAVADLDRDGDLDIVTINEGPTAIMGKHSPYGKILGFLNTNKAEKWQAVEIADRSKEFGGDYLAVGNFNGDRYPDVIGSSVYLNGSDIVYASDGKNSWKNVGGSGQLLPYFSYYYAVTTGKFVSKQRDDAVASFVRLWPAVDKRFVSEPKLTKVVGIELISFEGKARRRSVVRWPSEVPVRGVASGDFNGDGHLDIIYTPEDPRSVEILLGNGRGEFKRASIEGLTISDNYNYDVKVADVNKDGRADVILMYETEDSKSPFAARDGSIHVFLGRPALSETAAKKAAAR